MASLVRGRRAPDRRDRGGQSAGPSWAQPTGHVIMARALPMPTDAAAANSEVLPRPGILGRGVRFVVGAVLLLLIVSILRGSHGFIARATGWRLPGGDWWVVAVAGFVYLPRIFRNGFQRRWGAKPQAAALAALAAAAVWDRAAYHALWAPPLAILVLALIVFFLVYAGVAFLAAGAAATPG